MKILATAFCYNELPYIETWVKYYRSQGCELFVLDNLSNDGTYEWLIRNEIPCARIDTRESFHLTELQKALNKHIHRIKPDWVVYTGIDLFLITDDGLKQTIEKLDTQGFGKVPLMCFGALNTGEKFGMPLHKHFFNAGYWKDITLIGKYNKDFSLDGDNITNGYEEPQFTSGIMVNYGACKPAEEQEIKLKRREKAWAEGLRAGTGRHYRKGKAKNWIYSKEGTSNLKELYAKYINQLP